MNADCLGNYSRSPVLGVEGALRLSLHTLSEYLVVVVVPSTPHAPTGVVTLQGHCFHLRVTLLQGQGVTELFFFSGFCRFMFYDHTLVLKIRHESYPCLVLKFKQCEWLSVNSNVSTVPTILVH